MRTPAHLLIPTLLLSLVACTNDPVTQVPVDEVEEGVPNIGVSVTSIEFATAEDVGISQRAQVTVTNTGTADLMITNFSVDEPFSAGTTVLTLKPQSSQSVSLTYRPTTYETSQATLLIQSNDPDTPDLGVAVSGDVVLDADGDGYIRPEAGGDDCDDSRADINPDATDMPYDGVDADCAGDDDYDQDGDGYTAEAYGGDDCNDVRASINPAAEDIWYDNVDSNCDDANDYDQDGDGYNITSTTKKDCDDLDPETYPDAIEYLDGKKNDCNGSKDKEITILGAAGSIIGTATGDGYGSGIETTDLDGDGTVDFMMGAESYGSGNGEVFIWLGTSGMPADGDLVSTSDYSFSGSSNESLGSNIVYLGDAGGGGDVGIGAKNQGKNSYMAEGRIYVIAAEDLAGGGDTGDAHTVIDGYVSGSYYSSNNHAAIGEAFNSADLNGDGIQDLMVWSNVNPYTGYTYYAEDQISIWYGASGGLGSVTNTSADATFRTESYQSNIGASFGPGGDVNGDGVEDYIMGGPEMTSSKGEAWIMWGSATEYSNTSTSPGDLDNSFTDYWTGGESNDKVGASVSILPDMDGDGMDEIAIFAAGDGLLGLVWGSPDLNGAGELDFDEDIDLYVDMGSSLIPTHIRLAEDLSGDGVAEVIMVVNGSGSDQAFVFDLYGATGDLSTDDALVSFKSTGTDHGIGDLGHGFPTTPVDLTGDGTYDLVFGDPSYELDLDADGTAEEQVGGLFFWYMD
ncbi:MAG: hypothetical protein ACI9VR_002493 [Cognaticolwellia sp.]|jgi:hypothetical protein